MDDTTLYIFIKNGIISYINGVNHTITSITPSAYNSFLSAHVIFMENYVDNIIPGSSEAIYLTECVRLNKYISFMNTIPVDENIVSEFYNLVEQHMSDEYVVSKIIHNYSRTGIWVHPSVISTAGSVLIDMMSNNPRVFNNYFKYLVLDRNDQWIQCIDAVASNTSTFIVCGFAHIPDLLYKLMLRGYEIYTPSVFDATFS